MRYLGAALIIIASALIALGYKERLLSGVRALEEVLALIRHIRARVVCNLEPPRVWAADFSSQSECLMRLVSDIRTGVPCAEAYSGVREELGLPSEADACLCELFSSIGSIDIAAEGRLLGTAEDTLTGVLGKARDEATSRGRVALAIALMLSVGGAIVII